ncbi:aldolase [Ferrimonas lipolytica]|uniref:3-oxo-tetronate 4-phosphate decarboxylase n=2 Tax=Ferrimonas lipolytica TaxID=2724191 RepID=A0A6H1UJW6_9GAMM|nr:aldolase [Ferrimonas lipolytica]
MTEQQLRQQMVDLGRSLFERGYATGGAGNLSLRLPCGNVLATPTGSCMGRLAADRLSKVSIDGNPISGDKASKEVQFHLAMYRANPKHRAIVHLHCTYLTALSCQEGLDPTNVIKPFTPYYVMRIGKMPLVPYFTPGDKAIADKLAALAPVHRAMLLANHGPVCAGKDLEDAVNNMEELEETAKLLNLMKDQPIRYLSQQEVAELEARYG